MSQPNKKPDLDDSINVTETHGRVLREATACARENRIVDNGNRPISLSAILAIGGVSLIAGVILADAGNLFAYDTTFRPKYQRDIPPGAKNSGPVPKEALAAYMAKGAKVDPAKCNGCHGPDAKGNGSTYPSLVRSAWVNGETERLAMVILNGLQGPVSDGKTYGMMPPQGIGMTAEDLAGIMTYVRNNFGNSIGDVISTDQAKAALEISAKRIKVGNSVTAEELSADHLKALPGILIDSKTMLDPIKLEPIKEIK